MRRSVIIPSFCLSVFLLLTFFSCCAEASREKMILPDPSFPGTGMDAVLVIDVSGSMKQSDPEYLCREAALNYIEELSLMQGSRAALVTFSDTLRKVIPLCRLDSSGEDDTIIKELNALNYTAGDTDIGTAVQKAVSLLEEDSDSSRSKCIVLLTDGEIDLPAAPDEKAAEKESLTRALMAVEEAKTKGIVIHTVALDLSGRVDTNLMNYMADSTEGTSNLVNNASSLDEVFQTLSSRAMQQVQMAAETEEDVAAEETETEKETEEMTESETESETELVLAVHTVGSVDGPVHLKGILPNQCSAKLRLSDLFRLEGSSSGFTSALRYTAYPDDNSLLSCSLEGDMLILSGLKNGTSLVRVIAEPDDTLLRDEEGSGHAHLTDASLSFQVEIDAAIPSPWFLLLVPACVALAGIVIWFVTGRADSGTDLSGSLQWYVRGENEKIFGIPSQTLADLKDYGKKVRLSELVQDELLGQAPLDKVTISATDGGILITSRSSACLISESGAQPSRSLEIRSHGRFKVFCDTGSGRAAVVCLYSSEPEYRTEPSTQDDSEERTRLLV